MVTVPNTNGYPSPKAFTTQLFNHWSIGKAAQNNGVLFLISVGERRVEIETGTGLATILPDARVQQIIDSQILPKFRAGDFDGGTLAGVQQLIALLESRAVAPTPAAGVSSSTATTSSPTVSSGRAIRGAWDSLQGVDTSLAEGILLLSIGGLGLTWQLFQKPVYLLAQRGNGPTL
ncbi:MAG: TPM domain-containing protein [Thermostichus sp. DG02_5_bins_236]